MTALTRSSALAGVQAFVFDVFGTVVDWQGTVSSELQALTQGLAEEGAFA